MASRPTRRQPWYAAWLLLAAAFSCGVFNLYVPAAVLLAASVASAVLAFRPIGTSGDARAPKSPRQ